MALVQSDDRHTTHGSAQHGGGARRDRGRDTVPRAVEDARGDAHLRAHQRRALGREALGHRRRLRSRDRERSPGRRRDDAPSTKRKRCKRRGDKNRCDKRKKGDPR